MVATFDKVLDKKSLADRESAIRTIDMEIQAISTLKNTVVLENLTKALDIMQ